MISNRDSGNQIEWFSNLTSEACSLASHISQSDKTVLIAASQSEGKYSINCHFSMLPLFGGIE